MDLYDTIVIGAGINGCGIARELTERGQRVLVLDKSAVGKGTSSRSSRLIHGGLRYLETLRFGLVREALLDRQELVERYPDLVALRPFYLPVYQNSPRPTWMLWAGVRLYDFLAGRRSPWRSGRVDRAAFLERFSAVQDEGLRAVLVYADGKTNDHALTGRVAEEARGMGCEILEGQEVREVDWSETRIRVETIEGAFEAKTLVNATGPWMDEFIGRFELPARYQIRKVSGIHLFLDGLLVPDPLFLQTGERRIFFVIPEPENGQTMIGTTEREETGIADEVQAQEEDVAYLLREVNAYLKAGTQVHREDVREVCIGIRPLVAKRGDPTNLSREYELDLHRKGETQVLHVFGGKLTTYLSLARKVAVVLER